MIKKFIIILLFTIPLMQYAQVNYETEIQPIFNSSCISCHSGPSPSAGIDLTSFTAVIDSDVVIEGDYENSILWTVIDSGYMPFGAPDLSDSDVNLVAQWISELGGSELSCDISFDPIPPTSQSNSVAISPDVITDLTIGMEVGLFSLNDAGEYICSSTFTWEGMPDALAGFGAEIDSDGFISGGEMFFFATDDDGTIYELEVSYLEMPGFSTVWSSGGLSAIISISIINSLECGGGIEDIGCTDETACNYNVLSTIDDGSCIYADDECEICFGPVPGDGTGVVVDNDTDDDGICDADEVAGCTDPLYEEYDPLATDDDGS